MTWFAAVSPPSLDDHLLTAVGRHAALGEQAWIGALVTSMRDERDDLAALRGKIPEGLRGTLYRNGPGLFERGGRRKTNMLDGDGMIRAYRFGDEGLRFRNRFVRTEKFLQEEVKQQFVHSTWSLGRPGGLLANLGDNLKQSQAGVTVYPIHGHLVASDEVDTAYEIDPADLTTIGRLQPIGAEGDYKAHVKHNPMTGDWIMLANSYGQTMKLWAGVWSGNGHVRHTQKIDLPRRSYVHDFFATERYAVVNVQAVEFSPWGYLFGLKSFIDGLSWKPELGNIALIIDLSGNEEPVMIDAPPSWMWHALNAYEQGGDIIADFVGYDRPDHFIGRRPLAKTIMTGEPGDADCPGAVRRWVITPAAGRLREEIIDPGNHEFPFIDPRQSTRPHRIGYVAIGGEGGFPWQDGIARIDLATGERRDFRFGPKSYVGEPVFAAKPFGSVDEGWLLVEVHDGNIGKNSLAVFDAEHPEDGPIVEAMLGHHLPLSFHGWWLAG